ncbi:copper resistance CopC family protein [Microbacterium sp. NPDC076911]|uniref:copper resistance CopC family protein n=1 Tax=Microbacterium sp. NPDC076911 TaxID=3154958 RepID=UPI00342EC8A0
MRTSAKSVTVLSQSGFAILAAMLLTFAALMFASPAHAHDELTGTDPAADSTVDALPSELTLTFSAEISQEDGASEIEVTDVSGMSLAVADPSVSDNVLTQPLEGDATGEVTVLWKVVSNDGHPISGEYSFTVAAPEPTETPEPTATEEPIVEPTTQASAEPSATATVDAVDAENASGAVWPWVVGGIVVVGVAGAVTYLLVSRSRQKKSLADSDPTTKR